MLALTRPWTAVVARVAAHAALLALLPCAVPSHAGPSQGGSGQGSPQAASASSANADSKADPRRWLQRISKAAASVNYQGTMMFSAGGTVSTSRLSRYGQGANSFEHTESLDGPPRQVYRHNQLVHTLWPAKRVAVVEQREALSPFPALPVEGHDALTAYDVKLEGVERVAAHAAQVMLLAPRDDSRFAQRLWADVDTGLMLRADVLGPDGRVLESSGFAELKVGVKPQHESLVQAMHKLDGYRVVRAAISRTKLAQEGWQLKVPLAGFAQISCVTRPLDGGEPKPGAPAMVQAIYSDGLVHVSVFIEPFNAERHKPMLSSWGATHTLTQQRDDRWITVMGDVPIETIKQFAAALDRVK
jgi:sigma-E factor negative regulatory protein RseB